MNLYQLAREITEEVCQSSSQHWKPGDVVTHPDGYDVEIIDGQWWGTYGLSNFWTWKRLDNGKKENGYGW